MCAIVFNFTQIQFSVRSSELCLCWSDANDCIDFESIHLFLVFMLKIFQKFVFLVKCIHRILYFVFRIAKWFVHTQTISFNSIDILYLEFIGISIFISNLVDSIDQLSKLEFQRFIFDCFQLRFSYESFQYDIFCLSFCYFKLVKALMDTTISNCDILSVHLHQCSIIGIVQQIWKREHFTRSEWNEFRNLDSSHLYKMRYWPRLSRSTTFVSFFFLDFSISFDFCCCLKIFLFISVFFFLMFACAQKTQLNLISNYVIWTHL